MAGENKKIFADNKKVSRENICWAVWLILLIIAAFFTLGRGSEDCWNGNVFVEAGMMNGKMKSVTKTAGGLVSKKDTISREKIEPGAVL